MEPIRKTMYSEKDPYDKQKIHTVFRNWLSGATFFDSWICERSFLIACMLVAIIGSSVINQLIDVTSTRIIIIGIKLF